MTYQEELALQVKVRQLLAPHVEEIGKICQQVCNETGYRVSMFVYEDYVNVCESRLEEPRYVFGGLQFDFSLKGPRE